MTRIVLGLMSVFVLSVAADSRAQEPGGVRGDVVDPLGARVPGAQVALVSDGQQVAQSTSNDSGEFAFQGVTPGRYELQVRAEGFAMKASDAFFVAAGRQSVVNVPLAIGPLRQEIAVTATAAELPVSQLGAQVTVIDSQTLEDLAKPDVLEALRLVPGTQIVQTGQRGGTTSFFVRGGASNFNKFLIDGVPVNDIGGGFDLASVSTAGVDRIEVLREANSVLHGTDSLTGVVSIMTRRGRTRTPELAYSIDGGNLSTMRHAISVGGAVKQFDYFSEFNDFRTDNDLSNNASRTTTYAGRFGVALGGTTDISATIRHADSRYESPYAFRLFGISDDSVQDGVLSAIGVTARSQFGDRLQTTFRVTSTQYEAVYSEAAPTGEAFDPFGFGGNYLGDTVTIRGANGTSVTGRAILDYGGTYPSLFAIDTARNMLSGQANYQVSSMLDLSGGARYERESGFTQSGTSPKSESERNNGGAFVEARASLGRVHATGGVGFEHNAVFGNVTVPRVSVAAYLRNPSATSVLGDTKVILNAGKGIKASAIYQELASLYSFLTPQQAASLGIDPIGPERAMTFDAGVEQGLVRGHFRVRATFFRNDVSDLIEYVSKSALPRVGVPAAVAAATDFGAYVNSQSFLAQGLEMSVDGIIGRRVRVAASYTYTDAETTESFAGGVLAPATNPAFPGVTIGKYSPLVGERPFRRPAHSGSSLITYMQGRAQVTLAGYFTGKSDDSTYLDDGFFGNSMLLPNQDLLNGYQKVDLSGSYRIHPRLRWYASIENLANKEYDGAFGFPALPRTLRTGVTVTLGGSPSTP